VKTCRSITVDPCCPTSNITVNPPCANPAGNATYTLNAGLNISGVTATLPAGASLQWEVSTDAGVTYTNIAGGTTTPFNYTVSAVPECSSITRMFRCTVLCPYSSIGATDIICVGNTAGSTGSNINGGGTPTTDPIPTAGAGINVYTFNAVTPVISPPAGVTVVGGVGSIVYSLVNATATYIGTTNGTSRRNHHTLIFNPPASGLSPAITPSALTTSGSINVNSTSAAGAGTNPFGSWQLAMYETTDNGGVDFTVQTQVCLAVNYTYGLTLQSQSSSSNITAYGRPNSGTAFTPPVGCSNAVTLICPGLNVGYALAAAGPYGAAPVTPLTDGNTVYYQVSVPGAPALCFTPGSYVINGCCVPAAAPVGAVGATICGTGTATLTAPASATTPATYVHWHNGTPATAATLLGGTATTGLTSWTTPSVTTTTTFYVSYDVGTTCFGNTTPVVVTVDNPAVAVAGSDATICQGIPYTLTGSSISGSATTGTWTIAGGAGTLSTATATATPATVTFTPTAAATYTLTLTTNDPTGVCNAVSDQVILTSNLAPTVNAGTDATICGGASYTLSSATIGGGATTGTWSIVSTRQHS
jgi:hypothetical protein